MTKDTSQAETFTGQMTWPCTCGHPKSDHYFGDRLGADGRAHTWCGTPDDCQDFHPAPPGMTKDTSREAAVAALTAEELVTVFTAHRIGAISYEGDSWFAADAGYEYDSAELTMNAAGAILARLSRRLTEGSGP